MSRARSIGVDTDGLNDGATLVFSASEHRVKSSSGLTVVNTGSNYTSNGKEDRINVSNASGGTVTLPVATSALEKRSRLVVRNMGDSGTWTVILSGSDTMPGGATSVTLTPDSSLEVAVDLDVASGHYRWGKV